MKYSKIIGIILITIGLTGFLIMNGNIIGYVVSEPTNLDGKLVNNNLAVSGIEDIESSIGRRKTIELDVKNIGDILLNDCEIISKGEITSWIYSYQSQIIVPNERVYITYDLAVPNNANPGIYNINLEISCEESSISKDIILNVKEGLDTLKIKEIGVDNFELNITYIFDNTNFIGESMSVNIWIINNDGFETKRVTDSFPINRDDLINRNVLIKLSKKSLGTHRIFLALSSDLEDYLDETIFVGKPSITGKATFNISKNNGIAYIIFLIIIGIGIYFIFRRRKKSMLDIENTNNKNNKKEEYFVKKT